MTKGQIILCNCCWRDNEGCTFNSFCSMQIKYIVWIEAVVCTAWHAFDSKECFMWGTLCTVKTFCVTAGSERFVLVSHVASCLLVPNLMHTSVKYRCSFFCSVCSYWASKIFFMYNVHKNFVIDDKGHWSIPQFLMAFIVFKAAVTGVQSERGKDQDRVCVCSCSGVTEVWCVHQTIKIAMAWKLASGMYFGLCHFYSTNDFAPSSRTQPESLKWL